ncbi:hypothetical protein MBLNU13_g11531t2 [Cladosporium sp. NU13]
MQHPDQRSLTDMRFDDLELPTQLLILINTLIAVILITILITLKVLVGISFCNLPNRAQLFGTVVILYILVNTFPDFFGALWANLSAQPVCAKSVTNCYAAGGATWMDNLGLRKRYTIAACNAAWLTCHGATAVAFTDRVVDCFKWLW